MSRRIFTRLNNGELSNSWKHTGAQGATMNVTCSVFGCTGFLGRYVAGCAAYHRYTQICPFRFRSGVNGSIRPVRHLGDGTYGQMFPTDYELDKEFVVKAILEKVDNVFNCIGSWQEPHLYQHGDSWYTSDSVNVEFPRMLARWSREMGINRFMHLSMVGADPNSTSKILRQKGLAELAVMEEFPRATIIRSSDAFAEDDWTYTRYLKAQRYWKITPVPNKGHRIHQPVFAGDIAEAMVRSAQLDFTEGRTAELGGPIRITTNDLLRWVAEVNGQYNYTVPVPKWFMWLVCAYNERSFIRKGSVIGSRIPSWNKDWLERQYIDNAACPERDPELLDWEDLGISRDDLFRIEEKFFLAAHMYSKELSYIDNARYL